MKNFKLKQDLRRSGAGSHESAELAKLAGDIEHIQLRGLSAETKDKISSIPGKPVRYFRLPTGYAVAGALAIAVFVVGIAQTAQPGNPLYKVKRGTEQVRTWVQPDYVETLVEERKTEVEQLKQEAAAPEKIERAERAYEEIKERSKQRRQQDDKNQRGQDRQNRRKQQNNRSDRNQQDDRSFDSWWGNSRRR